MNLSNLLPGLRPSRAIATLTWQLFSFSTTSRLNREASFSIGSSFQRLHDRRHFSVSRLSHRDTFRWRRISFNTFRFRWTLIYSDENSSNKSTNLEIAARLRSFLKSVAPLLLILGSGRKTIKICQFNYRGELRNRKVGVRVEFLQPEVKVYSWVEVKAVHVHWGVNYPFDCHLTQWCPQIALNNSWTALGRPQAQWTLLRIIWFVNISAIATWRKTLNSSPLSRTI